MVENSLETKDLLNPAFCGLIYASIVEGFNAKSNTPIPFYLPYILMPLVLHKESRLLIPSTSIKKFHGWLHENEQIKMGLAERAKGLKPFVSQAMTFLHGQEYISIDQGSGIRIKNLKKLKAIINKSDSIAEYLIKAKTLGAICGKNNSEISILALLGVRP